MYRCHSRHSASSGTSNSERSLVCNSAVERIKRQKWRQLIHRQASLTRQITVSLRTRYKVAVLQFNEIHNFTSSFIFQCNGILYRRAPQCQLYIMHFVCLSINIKFQSRSVTWSSELAQ